MCIKGCMQHKMCLCWSAHCLPCHILANVDQKIEHTGKRVQDNRETRKDQRWPRQLTLQRGAHSTA